MIRKRLARIAVKSASLRALVTALIFAYRTVALMRFFQSYDPQRQAYPGYSEWLLIPSESMRIKAMFSMPLKCLENPWRFKS